MSIQHGTREGWELHKLHKTKMCDECADALDEYDEKLMRARGMSPARVGVRRRWSEARTMARGAVPQGCPLSEREWEVAALVTLGMSDSEIGVQLQLAETTIKTHMRRILGCLGVRSRTEMTSLIYRRGWLPADLAATADRVAVPRELFQMLARITHLAACGRTAEAREAARKTTALLPPPLTHIEP